MSAVIAGIIYEKYWTGDATYKYIYARLRRRSACPKKLIPGTVRRPPPLSLPFRFSCSALPLLRLIEFHALISRYRRLAMPHKSFKRCINYLRLTHFASQFSHFFFVLGLRMATLRILNACLLRFSVRHRSIKYLFKCPQVRFDLCFRFLTRFSHTLSSARTRLVSSII